MNSRRYDDEELKHLQKIQLMMLKDFIKICEDNDILYFINGGSLLGAVRHGGFIPWDDDIDLMMFRKDFEKLDFVFKNEPNDKYRLINVLNEETYHYTFARVMLKGTVFEEWWADKVDYTQNIFMDIFILDNIPDNKIKRFIHILSSHTLNQLTKNAYMEFESESKIKSMILKILHKFFKANPKIAYSIKKRCIKTYRKYEDIECRDVCDFPAVCGLPIYKKEYWLPPKKAKFEDIEVNIPNDTNIVLTIIYGDYMKLPPKEKRFREAPKKIDFGKY